MRHKLRKIKHCGLWALTRAFSEWPAVNHHFYYFLLQIVFRYFSWSRASKVEKYLSSSENRGFIAVQTSDTQEKKRAEIPSLQSPVWHDRRTRNGHFQTIFAALWCQTMVTLLPSKAACVCLFWPLLSGSGCSGWCGVLLKGSCQTNESRKSREHTFFFVLYQLERHN